MGVSSAVKRRQKYLIAPQGSADEYHCLALLRVEFSKFILSRMTAERTVRKL